MAHDLLDEHDFALIDPLADPPVPPAMAAQLLQLAPAGLRDAAHLLPRLLPLRALRDDRSAGLHDWVAQGMAADGHPPFAALLRCELDGGALAGHLARRLLVTLADGGRYLLRLQDPRVFVHLDWLLEADQWHFLFGPVSAWTVWLHGRWHRLAPPPGARRCSALQLERAQSGRLLRLGALNRVLASQPAPAGLAEFRQLAQRVAAHLERAAAQGWRDESDWVAFARLALQCHPRFDSHPEVRALIAGLPAAQLRFADAIGALDHAARARIAAELGALDPP